MTTTAQLIASLHVYNLAIWQFLAFQMTTELTLFDPQI